MRALDLKFQVAMTAVVLALFIAVCASAVHDAKNPQPVIVCQGEM